METKSISLLTTGWRVCFRVLIRTQTQPAAKTIIRLPYQLGEPNGKKFIE